MIKHVKGDAVKLNRDMSTSVLVHVCNDAGVMGSGIALQIKNEHPSAYKVYKQAEEQYGLIGGTSSYCTQSRIFNMVAQRSFGPVGTGRFLHYGWLAQCLADIGDFLIESVAFGKETTIIIPVKMGAFRAGGDWDIVKEMCEHFFQDFNIIYCEFDKG